MTDDDEANLPKLLSALAAGVRAVHNIPLGCDFDYQSSFPDFRSISQSTESDLIHILSLTLNQDLNQDDPSLWDTCADICDFLLEQTETYLSKGDDSLELSHWSHRARQQAQSSYSRMLDGLVEMEKPQVTHKIHRDNSRHSPFIPVGSSKTQMKTGRGNDTHYGGSCEVTFLANDVLGPKHYVPHLKREEIVSLKCTLKAPHTRPKPIIKKDLSNVNHTWVSTICSLEQLAKKLQSVTMMAVDLEAHSYRSFSGMICLMQITFVEDDLIKDYLVDTLVLWHEIHCYLAGIFSNPQILKVMHGADSDICWLQRDFGIYVVNLLDTGRASRLLKLPSFGLAYLLKRYVNIDTDKSHQLSDWRQRPLPNDMQLYAKLDTHFLINISQHMLWDISNHSNREVTIEKLFEASQQVSLIRYDKEVFRINGYKSIMNNSKRKSKTNLSAVQEEVLASLYDWRDLCARACDESPHYVCQNKSLLRLALACPTSVTSLQSLLNPMPPLVLQYAQDILKRINTIIKQELTAGPLSAAFFKPAEPEEETRGLLSPVLGTEALYKQAGWMTPSVQDVIHASTDDDDDGKTENFLLLDSANQEYCATRYTSHSLTMGKGCRGKATDGKGTANGLSDSNVEKAATSAQRTASAVRKTIEKTNFLCLISPVININNGENVGLDEEDDGKECDGIELEHEIPKSMREIYKVSNRNRRNKKALSTLNSELDFEERIRKDESSLMEAERTLAARGAAYFNAVTKKQKGNEDETERQPRSQEDDIDFIKEIGWLKKEEVENLKTRSRGNSEDFETDEERGTIKDTAKSYDYSNVGSIGVYDPSGSIQGNPFFLNSSTSSPVVESGASLKVNRDRANKKRMKGKPRDGRQLERPDKKEGRNYLHKKK